MPEHDRTDLEAQRRLDPRESDDEPDGARKITFTIAVTVTILFLLVTAGGLGWFLSDNVPLHGATADEPGHTAGEADGTETDTERTDPADGADGAVSDPNSGLSYVLPGDGWQRLGDDEVPAEYSTYAVYGSPENPDAIIVTGGESLGPLEPLALTAVDMATDMVGPLVAEGGDLRIEPTGNTEVDDHSAFGATMGGETADGGQAYGRFLVVELDGDQGAFMLGLNTAEDATVTEAIDAAFESAGVL